ncbi:MAG: hydroxymethylbilane synthase [bacterium]
MIFSLLLKESGKKVKNLKKIVIGTRGSKLALWQANWVQDRLRELVPEIELEVSTIKTEGDERHDLSPEAFGKEGIFTAELDRALLEERIDIAVHSLKDLPTRLPEGLTVAACTERGAVGDTLIIRSDRLPPGAGDQVPLEDIIESMNPDLTVGTSSLRRIAQLKNAFPRLSFAPMRGNLDTRVRKLSEGHVDALVVASAGLARLSVKTDPHLALALPFRLVLPAAGQGSLGLETREEGEAREIAKLINHSETSIAVRAERKAMSALGAGCRVPAGFLATVQNGRLHLRGVVAHVDGEPLLRAEVEDSADNFDSAGRALAEDLLQKGAEDILKEVRE